LDLGRYSDQLPTWIQINGGDQNGKERYNSADASMD
jgi:hypothetical protein